MPRRNQALVLLDAELSKLHSERLRIEQTISALSALRKTLEAAGSKRSTNGNPSPELPEHLRPNDQAQRPGDQNV